MKMQIRVAAEGNVLITKTYEYEKYEVSLDEVMTKVYETAAIVQAPIESMRVRFDKAVVLVPSEDGGDTPPEKAKK